MIGCKYNYTIQIVVVLLLMSSLVTPINYSVFMYPIRNSHQEMTLHTDYTVKCLQALESKVTDDHI